MKTEAQSMCFFVHNSKFFKDNFSWNKVYEVTVNTEKAHSEVHSVHAENIRTIALWILEPRLSRLIGNYFRMARKDENVCTSAVPISIPVPKANTAMKPSLLIWSSDFFNVF